MERHHFRLIPYVTLTWQLLLFSLVAAFVLSRFLESRLVWMLPVCVLALTMPYIARIGDILRDLRRGERRSARLILKDASEEYAIAIHRQRGLVHWTLIFEEEARPGTLVVLSAAARRGDMEAWFHLESSYLVEWLPLSRIISAAEPARKK